MPSSTTDAFEVEALSVKNQNLLTYTRQQGLQQRTAMVVGIRMWPQRHRERIKCSFIHFF